jgi:hypothetical protein
VGNLKRVFDLPLSILLHNYFFEINYVSEIQTSHFNINIRVIAWYTKIRPQTAMNEFQESTAITFEWTLRDLKTLFEST